LLDAYNANPSSMEHAIAHFAGLPQLKKAPGYVVLGDMAELGDYGPQEHARIASLLEATGLEGMCVGPAFAAVVRGKGRIATCLSPEEAREVLAAKGLTGRTVLLKGSRSSALEGLLDVL
jgi:UDP-N-acetylmuramoyl-tripeptide--D-alanyl-D-alanine ligase